MLWMLWKFLFSAATSGWKKRSRQRCRCVAGTASPNTRTASVNFTRFVASVSVCQNSRASWPSRCGVHFRKLSA